MSPLLDAIKQIQQALPFQLTIVRHAESSEREGADLQYGELDIYICCEYIDNRHIFYANIRCWRSYARSGIIEPDWPAFAAVILDTLQKAWMFVMFSDRLPQYASWKLERASSFQEFIDTVRAAFRYTITDWHRRVIIEAIEKVAPTKGYEVNLQGILASIELSL